MTIPLDDDWLRAYRDGANTNADEERDFSLYRVLDLAAGHDPEAKVEIAPDVFEMLTPSFHVHELVAALCDELLRLRAKRPADWTVMVTIFGQPVEHVVMADVDGFLMVRRDDHLPFVVRALGNER